jgi:hypothetical protein
MEFRWLTREERQTHTVESGSLSEILALAQKLQAEGEGLVSEEQVIEMGQELGVRPEYAREALRLRRRSAQPAQTLRTAPDLLPVEHNPTARVVQAGLLGLGLGTLPMALLALAHSNAEPVALCALVAAFTAGWSARYPRLAAVAGTLAVPAVIVAAALFTGFPSQGPEAFFLSLLSFSPLGSAAGRGAARVRRWMEHPADREPLAASRS